MTLTLPLSSPIIVDADNAEEVFAALKAATDNHQYVLRPGFPHRCAGALYTVITAIIDDFAEIWLSPDLNRFSRFGIQLPLDKLDGSRPGNHRPSLEVELGENTIRLRATEVFAGRATDSSYRLQLPR